MSSSYGSGYRRRSPYAPPEQDDQGYLSPYSPYGYGQGEDEGMSPLMRDAVSRNQMEGSRYQGGVGADQLAALSGLAGGSSEAPEVPSGGGAPLDEESYKSAYAAASGGSGNASWLTSAPEAAGAGAFSTTPEDRPPRSQEPITKAEVQRTGAGAPAVEPKPVKSETQQALDKKTAELEKVNKTLSGWGAPWIAMAAPGAIRHLQNQQIQLRGEQRDLFAKSQWEENRRGQMPKGRPFDVVENGVTVRYQMLANGQKQRMGEAPEPHDVQAARVRAQGLVRRAAAVEKGRLDTSGHLRYVEPETGKWSTASDEEEQAGPPTAAGETPASKYSPIQFPVPGGEVKGSSFHNLPENVPSYIDSSGKVQKNPNYVMPADRRPPPKGGAEKEDPIEKKAAAAAQLAMNRALPPSPTSEDEANAQVIYRNTYASVKSTLTQGKAGVPEIEPGTTKNFRDKKTGQMVPFRLGKNGKWQPVVGPVASHGQ